MDRQEALDVALGQIERQFGKGSVMKMNDRAAVSVGAVSTGSLSLDLALGIGGLPRGRIVEVFGPESSGKTTLVYHVIAEAQRRGGICAFIDAEHAMDPAYAKRIGVDIDNLLVSQPDTGEQALEITELLIRSGALDVVAIDSVAALTPKAEIEGEMGDSHVGLQARLMSQALRKLAGTLNRTDTICLFTNQLREKIGVMFGNPETTPGGRALKFYSSVRLDIRRIETLKDGVEAFGNRVRVKVVKNKVAPPFKQAEFDIIYGSGISWEGTVLDSGLDRKIVTKSGSYFSFGDERLGQGRQNATAFLREHPDLTPADPPQIQAQLGPEQIVSARLLPVAVEEDAAANGKAEKAAAAAAAVAIADADGRPTPRRGEAMVVTALRELPRGRVEVELDGAPWRVLPVDAVVRAGLGVGPSARPADGRARSRASCDGAGALRAGDQGAAYRDDRSRRALDERLRTRRSARRSARRGARTRSSRPGSSTTRAIGRLRADGARRSGLRRRRDSRRPRAAGHRRRRRGRGDRRTRARARARAACCSGAVPARGAATSRRARLRRRTRSTTSGVARIA